MATIRYVVCRGEHRAGELPHGHRVLDQVLQHPQAVGGVFSRFGSDIGASSVMARFLFV